MSSYIDGYSGWNGYGSITGSDDIETETVIVNNNITFDARANGLNLTLNNINYNITPYQLSCLKDCSSNIQQQINSLSNGGTGLPLTYDSSWNDVICNANFSSNYNISAIGNVYCTEVTASNGYFIGDGANPTLFVDKHPRYQGNSPTSTSNNYDYLPRIYYENNYVRRAGSIAETITGIKTFLNNTIFNGTISVGGDTTLSYIKANGNIDCCGNLIINCGLVNWFGTRNYGYYNLQTRSVLDNVGATANDAISIANGAQSSANNAQSKANDAYDLASTAETTAVAAAATAAGAAATGVANTAAIAVNSGSIATLQGEVSTLQGQVSVLEETSSAIGSKTQFMLPASQTTLQSKFINNLALYQTVASNSYSIYLNPFGKSTFYNDLETTGTFSAQKIDLSSGQVQNIRGSTVNIADSNGSTNIDCSFVSVGNVSGSVIQVGQNNSTLTANVGTLTLGNVASSNVRIGSSNSNITIGGLTSAIYIGGFLYVPFNPANFQSALKQWTL